MILVALLTFAAMLALKRAQGREQTKSVRVLLRLGAAALFAASLTLAIHRLGAGIGISTWIMALSIGALAVVALTGLGSRR